MITLGLPTCGRWLNQKPEVDLPRYGRHLVKSIWRHNSVGDHPIFIKSGRLVQNHKMPMMVKSLSKLGVDFKYGGRFSSATRNSNNLAVDWDSWSKFNTQIVFAFLQARCHKTRKQKNICDGMAAILKSLHDVITLSVIVQFRRNVFRPCRITWRWR